MYLVTIEDKQDGMWWTDPLGFDSKLAAKDWIVASKADGKIPANYHYVVYECHEIGIYDDKDNQ